MPAETCQLTILAPGLLGPKTDLSGIPDHERPQVDHLRRLLSRADWQQVDRSDWPGRLFSLFGFEDEVCDSPPVATITAHYDGIDTKNGDLLRADPVHLQIDIDRALMSNDELQLRPEEAESLLATLNRHFAEDGLCFEMGHTHRWYVRLARAARITTSDIYRIKGRNVHDFLPEGEEYRKWRNILNEVQMLLYAHDVNQQREAAGRYPANSVWFWGGGSLPGRPDTPAWDRVFSDDALVQAVAGYCDIPCSPPGLPRAEFSTRTISSRQLLVIDDFGSAMPANDMYTWSKMIEQYDKALFAPLEQALRNNKQLVLFIDTLDGRIARITKRNLRRWWRRCKPLTKWISKN